MNNVIYYGLLFVAALLGFGFRVFIEPAFSKVFYELDPEDLDGLTKWALKLCRAAKNIIDLKTGAERRTWVLNQITLLCTKYHIDLTEEQKRALLEAAYDEMNAQDAVDQAAAVATYTGYLDTTAVPEGIKAPE